MTGDALKALTARLDNCLLGLWVLVLVAVVAVFHQTETVEFPVVREGKNGASHVALGVSILHEPHYVNRFPILDSLEPFVVYRSRGQVKGPSLARRNGIDVCSGIAEGRIRHRQAVIGPQGVDLDVRRSCVSDVRNPDRTPQFTLRFSIDLRDVCVGFTNDNLWTVREVQHCLRGVGACGGSIGCAGGLGDGVSHLSILIDRISLNGLQTQSHQGGLLAHLNQLVRHRRGLRVSSGALGVHDRALLLDDGVLPPGDVDLKSDGNQLQDADSRSRDGEYSRQPTVRRLLLFLALLFGGFGVSLRGWLNLDNQRRGASTAWICSGLLLSASGYGVLFGLL